MDLSPLGWPGYGVETLAKSVEDEGGRVRSENLGAHI